MCNICSKKDGCKVKVKYLHTLEQIITITNNGDSIIRIEISCDGFLYGFKAGSEYFVRK
jgi:hypothetical protein